MFFKAASHPAVPREITEDLILSGRDTILLVVYFFFFCSLGTWSWWKAGCLTAGEQFWEVPVADHSGRNWNPGSTKCINGCPVGSVGSHPCGIQRPGRPSLHQQFSSQQELGRVYVGREVLKLLRDFFFFPFSFYQLKLHYIKESDCSQQGKLCYYYITIFGIRSA